MQVGQSGNAKSERIQSIRLNVEFLEKTRHFSSVARTNEAESFEINTIARRRGSGCVPFRVLGLRKPTLKARPRHIVRVCDANSVVSRANEVLAESIALFTHTFKTRHSTYYANPFTTFRN